MTNTATLSPAPEAANIDLVIGANVHVLMWRAQETQISIASMLGISQSALSLKLRGRRPWFAVEIDAMARHYRVTRDALFLKLPDLDSNQEPAGYKLGHLSQLDLHREAKVRAHEAVATGAAS